MADLSTFSITKKYPAAHPDVLQLYSYPTPNGIKVSAMLEETGLPYEPHLVKLNETTTPAFLSLNPNNKVPAILDPNGPGGAPMQLWESGAILIYLAEKTGMFLPGGAARHQTIQWVMFQMGGIGPMFGQLGFFHKFAGSEIDDPRPRERYVNEAKRLLAVLEQRLQDRAFIMGDDYTIADMASWAWVSTINGYYEAGDLVGYSDFQAVDRWVQACQSRPASQAAINIPDPKG